MLKIIDVSKKFKKGNVEIDALNEINLDFDSVGLTCIVGENGSGKSTLLNIISGMDKASSGHCMLELGEKVVYDENLIQFVETLISPNTTDLDIKFSQYNNLFSNCEHLSVSEMKMFDLRSVFSDENIKSLSSGEKQKYFLNVLNRTKCTIIVADEPSTNLDTESKEILFKTLKSLSKDKLVLVVTHNERLINSYADRVIRLYEGNVVSDDKNLRKDIPGLINDNEIMMNPSSLDFNIPLIKSMLKSFDKIIVSYLRDDLSTQKKTLLSQKRFPKKSINMSFLSVLKFYLSNMKINLVLKYVFSSLFFSLIILTCILNSKDVSYFDSVFYHEYDEVSYTINVENLLNNINTRAESIYENLHNEGLLTDFYIPTRFEVPNSYLTFGITGIRYYEEDEITLILGKEPVEFNEFIISDFLSMVIIENSDYSNFEDLIGANLEFEGYDFIVSGIIETEWNDYYSSINGTKENIDNLDIINSINYSNLFRLYKDKNFLVKESNSVENVSLQVVDELHYIDVLYQEDIYNSNNVGDETKYVLNNALYEILSNSAKNDDNLVINLSSFYSNSKASVNITLNIENVTVIQNENPATIYLDEVTFNSVLENSKYISGVVLNEEQISKNADLLRSIGYHPVGKYTDTINDIGYFLNIFKLNSPLIVASLISLLLLIHYSFNKHIVRDVTIKRVFLRQNGMQKTKSLTTDFTILITSVIIDLSVSTIIAISLWYGIMHIVFFATNVNKVNELSKVIPIVIKALILNGFIQTVTGAIYIYLLGNISLNQQLRRYKK
jgi:ABC-type lipoprotein export system ATPase subunit